MNAIPPDPHSPFPHTPVRGGSVARAAAEFWAAPDPPLPRSASPRTVLRRAVRTAVLAPSVLNTQPWVFHPRGDALELLADRTRQLRTLDPDGRRLTMSCGAALLFLRLGAAHHGRRLRVRPLPDAERPDLLALVEVVPGESPLPEEAALFPAVYRRHTTRAPFESRPIPAGVLETLGREAEAEGAALVAVADREAYAELVAAGAERIEANPAARGELAAWLRPLRAPEGEPVTNGIPDYAQGEWDLRSYTVVRAEDGLRHFVEHERRLAAEAPALFVLATATDTPAAWLAAGQALARVLLRAAAEGLGASFLDEPLLFPRLREKAAGCADGLRPQAGLRMGYTPDGIPTPRRTAGAVTAMDSTGTARRSSVRTPPAPTSAPHGAGADPPALVVRTILAPIDHSFCTSAVLERALELAARYDARLLVVHVAEPGDEPEGGAPLPEAVEVERIDGEAPVPALLDYARAHDVDLIVMGAHGRRGFRRLLLGSVAEEVVRTADRPVLTVSCKPDHHGERVLAPVDFSAGSRLSLQYAKAAAADLRAPLDVLHVVDAGAFHLPYGPTGYEFTLDALVERARVELGRFCAEVPGPPVELQAHVLLGSPAAAVAAFAEDRPSRLVVLSTHGRTGFNRLLMGSVAERVVRMVPCPVLTVRSEGRSLLPPA